MQDSVVNAWALFGSLSKEALYFDPWLAVIAARHGEVAALLEFIRMLPLTGTNLEPANEPALTYVKAFKQLCSATGTQAELTNWYQANRSRLRWDANAKRYVVQ